MAGPFTVESLSPHRVLAVDEDDELIDRAAEPREDHGPQQDFAGMILEQLATAGVQQAHKEDRIAFAAVTPWPGGYICAEGRYSEGDGDSGPEKRAGIFVGPEFGTVSRPDLVAAAREAGDAGFDVLIACAFNYEAHASEFSRLGRIPVLKARMNADLHMADELPNGRWNACRALRSPKWRSLQTHVFSGGLLMIGIGPWSLPASSRSISHRSRTSSRSGIGFLRLITPERITGRWAAETAAGLENCRPFSGSLTIRTPSLSVPRGSVDPA